MVKLTTIFLLLLSINAFATDMVFRGTMSKYGTIGYASDIVIRQDTTVNNTWNIPATTIIHFESDGHISGTGTINGGIIQASYLSNLFDTTLTVRPSGMYNINFSARWMGAAPSRSARDNRNSIQKAIDICKGSFPLFIPRGTYNIDTTLKIESRVSNTYVSVALHLFGESNSWDEGGVGTILQFQNRAQAGIALQLNKGTEIHNLNIRGKWISPTGTVQSYYARTYAEYRDSTCGQFYFGIEIDYVYNPGGNGSSGINIHDCIVAKFTALIVCSLQGWSLNADAITIENMYFGECRDVVISTQGQEKGNIMRNVKCWSSHYTFFRSGQNNNIQGGGWTIDGFNVTGGNQEFMINQGLWGQVNIMNGFMEQMKSLGEIGTNSQLKISNCQFDFRPTEEIGVRDLLNSGGQGVVFDNCLFRFFGIGGILQFKGVASYISCYYQGTYYNPNPNGKYQVVLPVGIRLRL